LLPGTEGDTLQILAGLPCPALPWPGHSSFFFSRMHPFQREEMRRSKKRIILQLAMPVASYCSYRACRRLQLQPARLPRL